MSCDRTDAHVHPVGPAFALVHGWIVVDHTLDASIITGDQQIADRIAELLNRHGVTDVPDDASDIAPPTIWAPPTGRPRRELAHIQRLPDDPTRP